MDNGFRLSVKSLEHNAEPKIIHAAIQELCSSITRLSGLEHTAFVFFPQPKRQPPGAGKPPTNTPEPELYGALRFEAPLSKFRVVLRRVGDWLDRTKQTSLFAIEMPPAHTMTLQTNQAKALAQLLTLGEALLPPQTLYLTQAESYVYTFGEITPAARANLLLVRHQVGISDDQANDLNARAMGPFKTLSEKYQHFRKELLACKEEITLDEDFWQVMQDKAITMSLPKADAEFLKDERLRTLRTEIERTRQQAEADAETERQHQRRQQQRLLDYRQTFEALVLDTLNPDSLGQDADSFRQQVLTQLSASEFNRGRLIHGREFYQLSQQEADALEKTVLDELYSLSGLLLSFISYLTYYKVSAART
ncbi:hypothetical protein VB780_21820 [Leptolyngbya sp. CCNP1308]|uniref:hypothetical protein n=1 Tax=Leptolyngbya sp. CCNP1308 TaxID=3110255 RepID=UPI002B20C468|nr:hypothetical protein [Leptolyngbya sp. CCNP1308]MEA5451234.1 hypothetical protein [Leptolyngbya sp. CCNP1308]